MQRKARTTGLASGNATQLRRAATAYGPRLIGTAVSWFAWDFYYYAQKLFQVWQYLLSKYQGSGHDCQGCAWSQLLPS